MALSTRYTAIIAIFFSLLGFSSCSDTEEPARKPASFSGNSNITPYAVLDIAGQGEHPVVTSNHKTLAVSYSCTIADLLLDNFFVVKATQVSDLMDNNLKFVRNVPKDIVDENVWLTADWAERAAISMNEDNRLLAVGRGYKEDATTVVGKLDKALFEGILGYKYEHYGIVYQPVDDYEIKRWNLVQQGSHVILAGSDEGDAGNVYLGSAELPAGENILQVSYVARWDFLFNYQDPDVAFATDDLFVCVMEENQSDELHYFFSKVASNGDLVLQGSEQYLDIPDNVDLVRGSICVDRSTGTAFLSGTIDPSVSSEDQIRVYRGKLADLETEAPRIDWEDDAIITISGENDYDQSNIDVNDEYLFLAFRNQEMDRMSLLAYNLDDVW